MADIMYYGADDRIPKILIPYFQEQKQAGAELSSMIHVKDDKALAEALIAMVFPLIIFDGKVLGENLFDFPKIFRASRKYTGKMIVTGDETDPLKLIRLLEGGWADYIIMPPDRPLLIEKVELYTKGTRSSDRQVYSMNLSQVADIARRGTMEELSEFGCKVRSVTEYPIEELVVLYSKALSATGESLESALGRCFMTEKHPSFEGQYLNHFSYVGVRPETLQNIRNNLRKTYAAAKKR